MFSHWWEESRDSGGPYTIQALYNSQVTLTICEKLLNKSLKNHCVNSQNNGSRRPDVVVNSSTPVLVLSRRLWQTCTLRARSVQVKDHHYLCVQQHTSEVDAHASWLCALTADASWILWTSRLEFEGFMDAGPLVWDSGPVDSVILSLFNICAAAVCENDWASAQQLGSFSGNVLNRCWKERCFFKCSH